MGEKLDVEHLLALARDKSAKSRTELAEVVGSLFGEQGGILSDREKKLMFNIIESLVHEVEVSVRKILSDKLADNVDAPRELIKALASDAIEVAYPVLSRSRVLRDTDLVEIIRQRTEEYHLAITLRNDLNEDVSDALIETKSEGVIKSLLHNENATISSATMEYLVEQSRRIDTFQEPLLHRSDLKEGLAKKMFMWVSAALRSHIVDRYELDTASVDQLLEEAAKEGYDHSMAEKSKVDSGVAELLKTLRDQGMNTPDMMLKALLDGEIPLFLALFSDLTNISDQLVRRIVFEEGGEGIAIACKGIGFSDVQFATIFRKSRRVTPNRAEATRIEVNDILDLYGSIKKAEAIKVINMWRRDTEYLSAIRDLLPDAKPENKTDP